ncbi:MAG: hypothetical protein U1G07_17030 [Verrucomicrobiota bacterium]
MDDFSSSSRNEAKFIHGNVSEDAVRVISESAESFGAKKPGKERVLVAHSVSYRMYGYETSALGEVLATLCGVKGGGFADIREFTGINVVDAPRIVASETLRPDSPRDEECDDCWPIGAGIQRRFYGFGRSPDGVGE